MESLKEALIRETERNTAEQEAEEIATYAREHLSWYSICENLFNRNGSRDMKLLIGLVCLFAYPVLHAYHYLCCILQSEEAERCKKTGSTAG